MADPPPSLDLFGETRSLLEELERREMEYALVGAVALAVYGVPRATTGIDLLIRPESLDAVIQVARELGFVFQAQPMRVDMSPEAVTRRLRRQSELRRACLIWMKLGEAGGLRS